MSYSAAVAKVYKPLVVRGETYRLLRLGLSACGPRFLLRDGHGRVYGVYAKGASAGLHAELLGRDERNANPLERLELVEGEGELVVAGRRV